MDLSYASIPWTSIWDIAIGPTNSQIIYAADHHSGVYLSTSGGASWVPINDGLTMKAVTWCEIALSPYSNPYPYQRRKGTCDTEND